MKLLKIIVIVIITLLPLSLVSMEKKLTKKSLTKELQDLKKNFKSHSFNYRTQTSVQNIINETKKSLNQIIVTKKTLISLKEDIDKANTLIQAALEQQNQEIKLKESKKQLKLEKQEHVAIPVQACLSPRSAKLRHPSIHYVALQEQNIPEPEDITPITSDEIPNKSIPDEQSLQNSQSSIELHESITSQLNPPVLKTTAEAPIIKQQINHISWKQILAYFSGAGLCTGIGIYSYYTVSPEHWYRPITIGLSALGGTTCSFFAYKNLKKRYWNSNKEIVIHSTN